MKPAPLYNPFTRSLLTAPSVQPQHVAAGEYSDPDVSAAIESVLKSGAAESFDLNKTLSDLIKNSAEAAANLVTVLASPDLDADTRSSFVKTLGKMAAIAHSSAANLQAIRASGGETTELDESIDEALRRILGALQKAKEQESLHASGEKAA